MVHKPNPTKRHPPSGMKVPVSQPARLRAMFFIVIAAILLLASCGQPAPTAPTVQSAVTLVVGTVQSAVEQAAPTVQAARTEVRATVQAGATEIAPTVVAGQATVGAALTEVAPTVQAARTEIAPTVQMAEATLEAVQTQIAPTAQAVATAVAATIQPPIATSVAASSIQIADVKVSQEDTTVALSSKGAEGDNISGWILFIGTFPLILPINPNLQIDPNETVTLHFSSGTDTTSDVYLGKAPDLLVKSMQPGTRFVLMNLRGQVASIYQLP